MTINQAAKIIGCSPLTIRIGLQRGLFPFGEAFKTKEDNKRYCYVLYPQKVKEYLGTLEEEQTNEVLN